jgi:hypothetical protein
VKSFKEKKKFNCTIFNFILEIEAKYLITSVDFNIINCIQTFNNKAEFIKSYPFYIIFILNYIPKNNYKIETLFELLEGLINGSIQSVFG